MLGLKVARLWLLVAALCTTSIRAENPFLHAGGTFDPFLLALQPAVQMSALPPWVSGAPKVDPVNEDFALLHRVAKFCRCLA